MEELDGRRFQHQLQYEYIPPFCLKCQLVGHKCSTEINWGRDVSKGTLKWIQKAKEDARRKLQ